MEGGGGQKMAKFCPRSFWMTLKLRTFKSELDLNGVFSHGKQLITICYNYLSMTLYLTKPDKWVPIVFFSNFLLFPH